MMEEKIQQYFATRLRLSDADARTLAETYYKNYGLALEGLVRHHQIGTAAGGRW
jgi:pyrimidine and pyridine-specific 5'-nucleotidase